MKNLSTNQSKRYFNNVKNLSNLRSSLNFKKLLNPKSFSVDKILTIVAVFSFFLIFGFILRCILVEIDSSDATTATASAGGGSTYASISNDNTVAIPITPTSTQAEYTATSDITFTNTCTAGSYIYLNTSTSDNNLTRTGEDSGTKTISPIEAGVSGLTNNTWGFKVDGKAFSQVPSSSDTPAILYESSTEETNTEIPVTYGVKIDSTTPSGTYTNDVVYTVVVDSSCSQYTLSFDLNGGTGASGVDYSSTSVDYGSTVNLSSYGTPTKTGYTFAGWSNGTNTYTGSADVNPNRVASITLTAQWTPANYTITLDGNSATTQNTATLYTTYNTNLYLDSDRTKVMTTSTNTIKIPVRTNYIFEGYYSGSSGAGTQYITSTGYVTPDGITTAKGYTSNQTWYAKWTAAVGIHSISTMQEMTSKICSASTTPAKTTTSLDQNGSHNGSTSYVPSTTLTDSRDNKTYVVRKLADGKCWMTQNLKLIGSKKLTSSDSNVSSNFTLPAQTWSGSGTYTSAEVYNTGNNSYGVYYNYYAASAGTISGESSRGVASYSICPKGWKLPTQGEYSSLLSAYSVTSDSTGSSKMRSSPLSFVYSGHISYGSTTPISQGSEGSWWSATELGETRYNAYVNAAGGGATSFNNDRRSGYTIRCVAQ